MKRSIIGLALTLFGLAAHAEGCFVSGVTDQYTYFVAVDSTDFTTRETGLTTFTVYRSRNGGVAAAFTTPTVNETDTTNMPGVYELLLDEDMTLDAGDNMQHMSLHITQASMAPVTKEICLERPPVTAGETLTVSSGVGTSGAEALIGTPTDFGSGTSTLAANLQDIADNGTAVFDRSTDSLQAVRDRGDAAWTTGSGGCTVAGGCIASGTAQAATATTLQLAASETFADDEIIGATVNITGGTTGVGQARVITDYVSSTDTATVDTWTTTPTGTITYSVFGSAPAPSTGYAADVVAWNSTLLATTNPLPNAAPDAAGGLILSDAGGLDADAMAASVAAIEADTNELQVDDYPTTLATLATAANLATAQADINAILLDTAEIGAAGAGLTAADDAVMTRLGAPAGASVSADIAALPTAADNAAQHLSDQRVLTGTCDSGSTTTCVDNALTQAAEAQLDDRLICFDDSWCALITGFTPATDTVTTTKVAPSTRAALAYTIFPATLQ